MKQTDHDRSLYLIHKYMLEHPQVFDIKESPSYGLQKGADLLAHNICMNVIEYVEVELDATYSEKFKRIAKRAKDMFDKYDQPVRLWLVSSSDKWVVGVRRQIRELGEPYSKKIIIKRISPLDLGKRHFPF